MCDIAPFQMKCENDEFKHGLTCCAVYHLRQSWNNLLKSFPVIGNYIPTYHCEGFKQKGGAA